MYRYRYALYLAALLFATGSPTVLAHSDTDGPFSFTAKKLAAGTSNGFYQYELRWRLRGSGHNDWDIIQLQRADTNLGPYATWKQTTAHASSVMPITLAKWHRLVAWKQNPLKVLGLYAPRYTAEMWVPAQLCTGGSATD